MSDPGYATFAATPATRAWCAEATRAAQTILARPDVALRHGGTWFVGVDALPNGPDGALAGVPLRGPWQGQIAEVRHWHRAQLSAVFPGYPGRDPGESDGNAAYRRNRFAAHVDGLLPEGPARRRYLREPHAFVLGLALDDSAASPLMVWPGSQAIMGAAFRAAIGTDDPASVDLTEAYHSARRAVFAQIAATPVPLGFGQAVLLHRHLLHGIAPWDQGPGAPRKVAYFRPQFQRFEDWL